MPHNDKFLFKVNYDSPGMNPYCYSMSGEVVFIPPAFIVEVDKCVFVQAEEIFANNRNIKSFIFPAKIYTEAIQVTYKDTYLEFENWGNGEQIYAVFTEQDRGIKYRVDILGVVIEATSQENESIPDSDDIDEDCAALFSEGPFQKCLSINKDHLQPKVYDELVAKVTEFNLKRSQKSHIMLFHIPSDYANSDSNGLGVLLGGTPWTNENLKRRLNKSADDVRASLAQLGLPDSFIDIIWHAGCAGTEVVIFEQGGVTFKQLPVF